MNSLDCEELKKQVDNLTETENQQKAAQVAITTDILNKLNTNIEALPQKCQQILQQTAEFQDTLKIDQLDPIALSLHRSKLVSERLEDEYEILKLKQKYAELQMRIDRNKKFLDSLRRELEQSRVSLESRPINPDNIQEHLRHLKLKVASYEESCEKAMNKYNRLAVPGHVYPASLLALATTLASLRDEAVTLKQRADDVALLNEARKTFSRLRK